MVKKLVITVSLIISLATVTGIMFKLDARWAKAGEVQKLSQRLDQKIEMDRAYQFLMWMTEMEVQHGQDKSAWPVTIHKQYATMAAEYERIMSKYGGDK